MLHLVGHAETFALPFAGLREEVRPCDHAIVRRIEADARQPLAHALARFEQPARMRDAREQREVSLRDAERLVRAIGFAPGGDFLTVHKDNAGDATARMHRPAQAVERRRVIVVDAPMRKVSGRIARPRNLVRLRKGDCFVELAHDTHGSQRPSVASSNAAAITLGSCRPNRGSRLDDFPSARPSHKIELD